MNASRTNPVALSSYTLYVLFPTHALQRPAINPTRTAMSRTMNNQLSANRAGRAGSARREDEEDKGENENGQADIAGDTAGEAYKLAGKRFHERLLFE